MKKTKKKERGSKEKELGRGKIKQSKRAKGNKKVVAKEKSYKRRKIQRGRRLGKTT
jgi:hypothetical protein